MSIRFKVLFLAGSVLFAIFFAMFLLYFTANKLETYTHLELTLEEVWVDMLTLRRNEKDFLARLDKKYIKQFNKNYVRLEAREKHLLELLNEVDIDSSKFEKTGIQLEEYKTQFLQLSQLFEKRGLNEKSGLYGSLRQSVHQAENALKALDNKELLYYMLILRRHEKDFMLRSNEKYVQKFNQELAGFVSHLEQQNIDAQVQKHINNYAKEFKQLVTLSKQIGLNPKSGVRGQLRNTVHLVEEQLKREKQQLIDNAGTAISEHNTLMYSILSVFGVTFMIITISGGMIIVRRINFVVNCMYDIATGEGDLTAKLEVQGNDEITKLSTSFNLFVDKIRSLIITVNQTSASLDANIQQLASSTQDSISHINHQTEETEGVASAMTEMTATIQEVAHNIVDTATAAENANQSVDNNQQAIKETKDTIDHLARIIDDAVRDVKELEDESNNISSTINVINEIADQTNLLALNAAIEAARAGEMGRGFAVVADEVRNLAQKTQLSTEEIRTTVTQLKNGVNKVVSAMESTQSYTKDGVEQINNTQISLAKIKEEVSKISEMSTQISTAAHQQVTVSEGINGSISNIEQSAESTSNQIKQIGEMTTDLTQLSNELGHLVEGFKVE